MKKLMAILLCLGLFTNSFISAVDITVWRCRPTAPGVGCTSEDIARSKKFFAGASFMALAALAAAAALVGTTIYFSQAEREAKLAGNPHTTRRAGWWEAAGQKIEEGQEELGETNMQKFTETDFKKQTEEFKQRELAKISARQKNG